MGYKHMSDIRLNELIKQFQAQEGGSRIDSGLVGGAKEPIDYIKENVNKSNTAERLLSKLKNKGYLSKSENAKLRFIKDIANADDARKPEGKNYLKKIENKELRAKAWAAAVNNEPPLLSPDSINEWGGPAADVEKKENPDGSVVYSAKRDEDGNILGFGRRFISKQAATRAFNKLNNSNRYKTHGTRAA